MGHCRSRTAGLGYGENFKQRGEPRRKGTTPDTCSFAFGKNILNNMFTPLTHRQAHPPSIVEEAQEQERDEGGTTRRGVDDNHMRETGLIEGCFWGEPERAKRSKHDDDLTNRYDGLVNQTIHKKNGNLNECMGACDTANQRTLWARNPSRIFVNYGVFANYRAVGSKRPRWRKLWKKKTGR